MIPAALAAYRTGDIAAASGRPPTAGPAGETVPAVEAVTRTHAALPVQTGEQTRRPLVPPPTLAENTANTGQSGNAPARPPNTPPEAT